MIRIQQCSGSAQALYNVFILTSKWESQASSVSSSPLRMWSLNRKSAVQFGPSQIRRYAVPNGGEMRRRRDGEITAREIQLVQADGTLGPPVSTSRTLRTYNRGLYHLVQLSADDPDRPTVCKIISKQELREKERAKIQTVRKAVSNTPKQLELNWAIDLNDLSHRLKKMQEFLGQGRSVEIILAEKKGRRKAKRKATSKEAEAVVRAIRAKAMEVEGARETKAMAGALLEEATLFFTGKSIEGITKP